MGHWTEQDLRKGAGGGVTETEVALQRNILMVKLKMKRCFFIVCIIILFTLLVHSCWGGDEAWLQQFKLQDCCRGNTAPIIISILAPE